MCLPERSILTLWAFCRTVGTPGWPHPRPQGPAPKPSGCGPSRGSGRVFEAWPAAHTFLGGRGPFEWRPTAQVSHRQDRTFRLCRPTGGTSNGVWSLGNFRYGLIICFTRQSFLTVFRLLPSLFFVIIFSANQDPFFQSNFWIRWKFWSG